MSDQVYIEVTPSVTNRRQSGSRERAWELLGDSKPVMEAAIGQGVDLALGATSRASTSGGWGLSEIELSFGLKLSTEAGFIVSSVSGEASIEVRIRVSRTD